MIGAEELSRIAQDVVRFLRETRVKEGIKNVLQEELLLAKEIRDTVPEAQDLNIEIILAKIDDAIKMGLNTRKKRGVQKTG